MSNEIQNQNDVDGNDFPINFKNIVGKFLDGRQATADELAGIIGNFPMWFGQDLIKEANEKDITIRVLFTDFQHNIISAATDDVDFIKRMNKIFLEYPRV